MGRIASVNGLRGLAILAILFSNITHDMFSFGPYIHTVQSLAPLISNVWTGIDLLFILSGFVLFLPYADGRRTMTGSAALWSFYRRRFLRLMPLYYLAIAIDLIVAPKSWVPAAWLLSGLFVLSPAAAESLWNWGLWLIGITIIFSIIFPALVWAWQRIGPWRVVPIVMLAALAARVLGYASAGIPFTFLLWGAADGAPYAGIGILGHLDEFVLGMLLAHLRAAGRIDRSAALLVWPGLLASLTAWFGLGYLGLVPLYWQPVAAGIAVALLAVGYTLIVAAALAPAGLLSRALSLRPLQVVGMMSYSLYVWHALLLHPLRPN